MHKLVMPELELWVLDEFNERYEKTPRMRSVDDEALQQDARDLFLDRLRVCLGKQVQQSAAEVMCVTVGVAQLVGYGIQKQISACTQTHTASDSHVQKLQSTYYCSLVV